LFIPTEIFIAFYRPILSQTAPAKESEHLSICKMMRKGLTAHWVQNQLNASEILTTMLNWSRLRTCTCNRSQEMARHADFVGEVEKRVVQNLEETRAILREILAVIRK
jgi:hypothetical protein